MLLEEKDRAAKESNQVLTKLTWEKERAARDALNHETYYGCMIVQGFLSFSFLWIEFFSMYSRLAEMSRKFKEEQAAKEVELNKLRAHIAEHVQREEA